MSGNFIPVAPGTANVTATYNGLTTVVPVTVAPPPPPSLPQPSGLAFAQDDYTTYATQAQYLANVSSNFGGTGNPATALYTGAENASWCTPDFSVTYNGHQTLQYQFPGGTSARPELEHGFAARPNIWYRAMIRFVPGFTTVGSGPNQDSVSSAYKMLSWALNNTLYDGSGRIEISNGTEIQCYWGCANKNTNAAVISTDTSFKRVGYITTEWQDGSWNQYVFNYWTQGTTSFCNTYVGSGASTPTLRSQGSAPNLDGLSAPGATGVTCGLNYNRVRGANQVLYLNYGFWEAVDGTDHPNPFGLVLP